MRGCRARPILVRMLGMGNALAAQLAPLSVLDEQGARVRLGRFWVDETIVLAFVRHFG